MSPEVGNVGFKRRAHRAALRSGHGPTHLAEPSFSELLRLDEFIRAVERQFERVVLLLAGLVSESSDPRIRPTSEPKIGALSELVPVGFATFGERRAFVLS